MKNVESFYPLSPMQEGMLYHTIYAPGSGAYMGQVTFRLTGALDFDAFRRAWQAVIERHPALRTIFLWKGVKTPVQVVRREVELPVEMLDWRGLDAGAHAARLREQLERERARGFDLTRAPLMRLAVIRLDGGDTQFVWSYHHLILDGWSVSSLFGEVAACFRAFARGSQAPALAPARPYRDYIVWLQRQDAAEAERFWRRELEGASVPTPVPARPAPDGGGEHARQEFKLLRLSDAELAALQAYARRQRLTVNTVAQGAWGLLLSHLSDRRDVVFGATVSGRPPELAGVEGMVGMFINTLPVRLRLSPDEALAPWLRALQARQVESRRFEYCSLRQIQTWCGVARGARLYDSLLAFHNYPGRITPAGGGGEGGAPAGGAGLGDVRAMSHLAYPLEMEVMPAPEATVLTLRYDAERVAAADVERVMGGFAALLRGAGGWADDATVGQLLGLLRDEDRRRQASQAEAYDEAAAKKLKGLRGLRARPQAGPAAPTTAKG